MSDPDGPIYDHDALVADARTFARTLEDAHPDPYTGHGGRVAFHRHLETLVREIPGEGESLGQFRRRLQRFAAAVGDGHTAVQAPEREDTGQRLPVDVGVLADGLVVTAVYDDSLAVLLGGRLRLVDGRPVGELRESHAEIASADNRYGHLQNLCDTLATDPDALARLTDTDGPGAMLTVELPDGTIRERFVEPTDADAPVVTLDDALPHPDTDGEPAYRLPDEGRVALLRIPDCTSYREHHEVMTALDREGRELTETRTAYRRLVGTPVPDDEAALIAGLPAASAVFEDLVEDMAEAGTETLVVDVRGNGGGSSILAYLLVYVLHGWDGVVTVTGDQYDVGKHSDLYRDQFGDDGPLGDPDTHAGFVFDAYFASDEAAADHAREQFTGMSPTLDDTLDTADEDGGYCPPEVLVVTDAETFSAGVEPAILLSKLGADVVGVPSGQSPNGPRDVLLDELPNTGLEFRLSFRHHVFLPGEDGEVFEPDLGLTWDRFCAMDCAADAGVRLALDYSEADVAVHPNRWDGTAQVE